MKKLDLSSVNSSNQFPLKEGTLDFLQLAYQEGLTAIANNLIGGKADTTHGYILWGCINTGSGLNYNISAGGIYYNGEIYLVDATTFTATSGNVAVAIIGTSQYTSNADPVTFTDGISRNVHNVKKIVFLDGASGSGIFDFASMIQTGVGLKNDVEATLPASYTVTFEQNKAVFFTSATVSTTITFDFTNAIPGNVVRLKWSYGSSLTLTINTPTGSSIIKDSGTLANVSPANNLLYMIYLGKNELGNNEVSYTLKQV